MRYWWSGFICVLAFALVADGQITKTATFDNYVPGTAFKPSFTDPLSGITFSKSTNPLGGFVIDSDLLNLRDGTNYLTAAGGGNDDLGGNFGFTATLPIGADWIGVEAFAAGALLEGFNSTGTLVAEQTGPFSAPAGATNLEISSSQYDITTFQVIPNAGDFEGYDNISYTILPEPAGLGLLVIACGMGIGRRKRNE